MLRSRGMWSEHLASGARKGRRVCMGDTLAQFSHNVMEQSAGTAVTPAAMRGSSKAERSDQHSGRGGGGFYSKEISREMGPFSPTLLQRKNDTSIVQLRPS